VRLIDASFIWTEPHSRRIKLKVTIQKEVLANTVLQQTFELTLVVHTGQCPQCTRLAAKNTWKASVQVRQKVTHKRTFLFLEQLILKHGAHKDTISISEKRDGLDFFYAERNHAIKMCEFLASVVPVRVKGSEQLISSDTHSNTANYKFTYSVEIVPVCKDDLVCLPKSLAKQWGNISPLTLCSRVGNTMHLMDPMTLQQTDVSAPVYWRQPFNSLAGVSDLIEFIVLDIEPLGAQRGKWVLADAQVTRSNRSGGHEYDDGMGDDGIYHTRTHLGAILQPGDTVLGYDLTNANYNNDAFETLDMHRIPNIILVKKTYPNRRKKSKPRNWKLKSMAKEAEDGIEQTGFGRGAIGRRGGVDTKNVERDYELFLRDLEEDKEMRQAINLYRAEEPAADDDEDDGDVAMGSGAKAGSGMRGGKRRGGAAAAAAAEMDVEDGMGGEDGDDEDEEEDFPEIELDELLENFEELDMADGDEVL
jgi:nonsense-mediated mRNA decay protein 3